MNWKNYILLKIVVVSCLTFFCIERKKMNNHQQKNGSFFARDNDGRNVVIEWHTTNIVSVDFAQCMKDAWSLARDAYIPVEMDFLKAFPEVVGDDPYFAPFEPLFGKGLANIDWVNVENTMETILRGHFVFDPTQFPKQVIEMFGQDDVICVTVTEQSTGKILGFITFLMRKTYQAGDVKVMSFAVDVAHQKRGLGKLLMSSIFKIVPTVDRIFLCTRVTNVAALRAYSAWGFIIDENPVMDHAFNLNHWIFMEYKIEQSDVLQKASERLSQ